MTLIYHDLIENNTKWCLKICVARQLKGRQVGTSRDPQKTAKLNQNKDTSYGTYPDLTHEHIGLFLPHGQVSG